MVAWYKLEEGRLIQENHPKGVTPEGTGWTTDLDSLGFVPEVDPITKLQEELTQTQLAVADIYEQLSK